VFFQADYTKSNFKKSIMTSF